MDAGNFCTGRANGPSSGFSLAMVFTCTSTFSIRYAGGSRWSSMPIDILSVDLLKGQRDLLEASDVIVVILRGGECELGDELGKIDLQAFKLSHRHFPGLESCLLLVLDQLPYQHLFAQLLLVRHSCCIHLAQSIQEGSTACQGVVIGLDGVIRELIVVTAIADGGGKLGIVLEMIFPVVGEDRVQRPQAVPKGKILRGTRRDLGGMENAGEKSEQDETNGDKVWFSKQTHSCARDRG